MDFHFFNFFHQVVFLNGWFQCPDMGKNVLKIPGIVHACPAASVQIILVIMVVGVMSGASEEDHSKILERFNMTRMPRAAQVSFIPIFFFLMFKKKKITILKIDF